MSLRTVTQMFISRKHLFDRLFAVPFAYSTLRGLLTNYHKSVRFFLTRILIKIKPEKVLDICCGPGDFVHIFHQQQYFGIDMSPEYVQSLHSQSLDHVSVMQADATRLPVQSGTIDMCVMVNASHHVSDAQFVTIVDEIRRVLQNNGNFLFIDAVQDLGNALNHFLLAIDRGDYFRTRQKIEQVLIKSFLKKKSHAFKNGLWHEWLFWGVKRV